MNTTQENIEDIINYFAISLISQNTVDEILWDLAKNCISKLGFEDCVVYLLDEHRKVLVQKAAYGPKNPKDFTILTPIEISLGMGIVGSVAQTGIAEIIPDTNRDARYIKDDAFRNSEISVPILLNNEVIGVIDSEHSEIGFFNERHLRILTLIASLCANKILWARSEEKVKREQEALSKAQVKLSEFKLMALRSQMNPHFIFNALNDIQYFITERDTGSALKFLSLFGKFIRKVLNASYHTFIGLEEDVDLHRDFLTLEKMRFVGRFDFTINIDETIRGQSVVVPVLLMHHLIDKVLTENILTRKGKGFLSVFFHSENDCLVCLIKSEYQESHSAPVSQNLLALSEETAWDWDVTERISLLNRLHATGIQINFSEREVEMRMTMRKLTD